MGDSIGHYNLFCSEGYHKPFYVEYQTLTKSLLRYRRPISSPVSHFHLNEGVLHTQDRLHEYLKRLNEIALRFIREDIISLQHVT